MFKRFSFFFAFGSSIMVPQALLWLHTCGVEDFSEASPLGAFPRPLCVFLDFVHVNSGFLPQRYDIHFRYTGDPKWLSHVTVCVVPSLECHLLCDLYFRVLPCLVLTLVHGEAEWGIDYWNGQISHTVSHIVIIKAISLEYVLYLYQ